MTSLTLTQADGTVNPTQTMGAGLNYDARGNMTGDGTNSFTFDNLNRLKSVNGTTKLSDDPPGRLYQKAAGGIAGFRCVFQNSWYVRPERTLPRAYDAITLVLDRRNRRLRPPKLKAAMPAAINGAAAGIGTADTNTSSISASPKLPS